MTERFTFAVRHRELLERHKAILETFGFVCTVEETTITRHCFEILTLVAVPPKNLHPIAFTKA